MCHPLPAGTVRALRCLCQFAPGPRAGLSSIASEAAHSQHYHRHLDKLCCSPASGEEVEIRLPLPCATRPLQGLSGIGSVQLLTECPLPTQLPLDLSTAPNPAEILRRRWLLHTVLAFWFLHYQGCHIGPGSFVHARRVERTVRGDGFCFHHAGLPGD